MPHTNHHNNPTFSLAMRSLAEDRLKKKNLTSALPALLSTSSPAEELRTLYELQLHQIELEMQQEELVESREALLQLTAELETSLGRYADLYEFAPTGYLTLACDTTILQVNLTATKMFGVERSCLKGNRFISFLCDDDRPVIETMFEVVFSNRNHQYGEATLLPSFSGHTVRIDAVLSNDGKECRVIMVDITERKKAAEATLKLSEDRHRYLFEYMLNGIAHCQMLFHDGRPVDFIYEQVNARFETLTGLKNVEGKKVSELIPGIHDLNPELLETYGRVATSGQPERFEFYLEPLKIWLEISAYSLKPGHFVTIFDNITERKLDDIAQKKLSVAIEQHPVIIVNTDSLGNIEYVNPAHTELTGYTFEEVKGKNLHMFQSGLAPALVYKEPWQTILSGEILRGEVQNKKKNGELYWVSEVISAVLDNDGKIINFVGIKQDITEQKRLLSELDAAKKKTKEAELLKAAFMANISHEMRTPVNGILGFSELLQAPDISKEEQTEYNDLIHKTGERLLHLINDLVDFSRIEAGETMLQITETPVNQVISDLTAFFKPEFDRKGLRLRSTTGLLDSDDIIQTDSSKLSQILTNLVQNALKFTTQGGIAIGYVRKDAMLEFYVEDSGIGIPDDMQQKIFDRFRQIDNTLTQFYKGSGLGLSISKAYVEMLGGTIRVESVEGAGSTFSFTLPYKQNKK